MNKSQYLDNLKISLIKSGLKKAEIDGALQYYDELIVEAMDNGETESEVIARLPSPQAAADEIRGINETSDEGTPAPAPAATAAQASPTPTPTTAPAPAPADPAAKSSSVRNRNMIATAVLLVVCAIFVVPIVIAIAATVFSVFAAALAVMVTTFACGVALPIYAVVVAIMSKSIMLLFVYLSGGFACLAVGSLLLRIAKPICLTLVKTIKSLYKATVSLLGGKRYEKA